MFCSYKFSMLDQLYVAHHIRECRTVCILLLLPPPRITCMTSSEQRFSMAVSFYMQIKNVQTHSPTTLSHTYTHDTHERNRTGIETSGGNFGFWDE